MIKIPHKDHVEINMPYSCSFTLFLKRYLIDLVKTIAPTESCLVRWIRAGFKVFFANFHYNANLFSSCWTLL